MWTFLSTTVNAREEDVYRGSYTDDYMAGMLAAFYHIRGMPSQFYFQVANDAQQVRTGYTSVDYDSFMVNFLRDDDLRNTYAIYVEGYYYQFSSIEFVQGFIYVMDDLEEDFRDYLQGGIFLVQNGVATEHPLAGYDIASYTQATGHPLQLRGPSAENFVDQENFGYGDEESEESEDTEEYMDDYDDDMDSDEEFYE